MFKKKSVKKAAIKPMIKPKKAPKSTVMKDATKTIKVKKPKKTPSPDMSMEDFMNSRNKKESF